MTCDLVFHGPALDGAREPRVLLGHGVNDGSKEFTPRELEANGETGERLERGVPLPALDAADVGAVEAGALGEGLLADAEFAPARADDRADDVHRLGSMREQEPRHVGHVEKLPGVKTLSPRTLVANRL